MFRNWLTKRASKTIEAAVEPAKEVIKKTIEQKSDWASKLLKLGLLSFITLIAFKEEARGDGAKEHAVAQIPNIVINNYIRDERSNDV